MSSWVQSTHTSVCLYSTGVHTCQWQGSTLYTTPQVCNVVLLLHVWIISCELPSKLPSKRQCVTSTTFPIYRLAISVRWLLLVCGGNRWEKVKVIAFHPASILLFYPLGSSAMNVTPAVGLHTAGSISRINALDHYQPTQPLHSRHSRVHVYSASFTCTVYSIFLRRTIFVDWPCTAFCENSFRGSWIAVSHANSYTPVHSFPDWISAMHRQVRQRYIVASHSEVRPQMFGSAYIYAYHGCTPRGVSILWIPLVGIVINTAGIGALMKTCSVSLLCIPDRLSVSPLYPTGGQSFV